MGQRGANNFCTYMVVLSHNPRINLLKMPVWPRDAGAGVDAVEIGCGFRVCSGIGAMAHWAQIAEGGGDRDIGDGEFCADQKARPFEDALKISV